MSRTLLARDLSQKGAVRPPGTVRLLPHDHARVMAAGLGEGVAGVRGWYVGGAAAEVVAGGGGL